MNEHVDVNVHALVHVKAGVKVHDKRVRMQLCVCYVYVRVHVDVNAVSSTPVSSHESEDPEHTILKARQTQKGDVEAA